MPNLDNDGFFEQLSQEHIRWAQTTKEALRWGKRRDLRCEAKIKQPLPGIACDYCRRLHQEDSCPGCGAPRLAKRAPREFQMQPHHGTGYGFPSNFSTLVICDGRVMVEKFEYPSE